ncbi:MAG: tocopherol cyclase family protein [Actinomycetota bacterium]
MRGPLTLIRGIRHPEAFHGTGLDGGFFEGWYVKVADSQQIARWAFIPGVFRGHDGTTTTDEAFLQVLDGATGESAYYRYDAQDFTAATDRFDVWVGPHHFSSDGLSVRLPHLQGDIEFTTPMDPWPVTWRRPGIMGWYAWVPMMECYHGVVSFGHDLRGVLTVNGQRQDFDGGRGYIEKDWGRAFPAGYVWMHSQHFAGEPTACLVASVAIIPWLRSSFRGFIVGLRLGADLHTWATYNGSRERWLEIAETHVRWAIDGPSGSLELSAERKRGGLLRAPIRTRMHERVEETLDAVIAVRYIAPDGRVVLDTTATTAGLEVHGDLERLLAVGTR